MPTHNSELNGETVVCFDFYLVESDRSDERRKRQDL